MDSVVLTLAIRWLEASDAFSASCVCREWQASLSGDSDGGDLWKQVLKNTHPLVNVQVGDYRRLALGFGRSISPAPPEMTFSPRLRFEDLFAIVDLYRALELGNRQRRVIEASWTCSVTHEGIKMNNDSENFLLKGLNEYSVSFLEDGGSETALDDWVNYVNPPTPLHFAWDDVLGHLECTPQLQARVTLFRRDNMKSVCLVDQFIDCYDNHFPRIQPDTREVSTYVGVGENVHFASNDAGRTAQRLMFDRFE
jgi:hypothetical protein